MIQRIYLLLLAVTYLTKVANSAENSHLTDTHIGCVADLQNNYFDLKPLKKKIKE